MSLDDGRELDFSLDFNDVEPLTSADAHLLREDIGQPRLDPGQPATENPAFPPPAAAVSDSSPATSDSVYTVLQRAAIAVARNEDAYGAPEDCFAHIAARWSLLFGIDIPKWKVPLAMIDLKIARCVVSPDNIDHYVDICGYGACAGKAAAAKAAP